MTDLTKNTSDLADLVTSTLQSSRSLHLTARGLLSQSPIPELIELLKALDTALEKLAQILTTTNAEFTALEPPLRSCGKCCKELNEQISQAAQLGAHNWATFEYMGQDIFGFTRTLKIYTSTIVIKMIDVALYVKGVLMWTRADTSTGLQAISRLLENASRNIKSLLKTLSPPSLKNWKARFINWAK